MDLTLSNNTLDVLFFIKKTKLLKNGEASICARITVNQERTEIMIKRSVPVNKWNQVKQCATGNDHTAKELNCYIDTFRNKVFQIVRQLENDNSTVNAKTVSEVLQGRDNTEKSKTLIQIYAEHNAQVHSLVGIDYAECTAKKFDTSLLRLKEYMQHQYKADDMPVSKIDYQFVKGFDVFLKTMCGCHHNSALKHLKNLKKIIRIALANDWIRKDPFFGISFKVQETEIEFLSKQELNTLINHKFKIPQHEQVRDIFVYCCFTDIALI